MLVNLPAAPREKQTQTSVLNSVHFVPASEHTGIEYNLLGLTSVYAQIKIRSRDHVAPREYRNKLYFFENSFNSSLSFILIQEWLLFLQPGQYVLSD